MSKINYEEDRIHSITQADAAKSLSNKVIELKNLEDEIKNAEESVFAFSFNLETLSSALEISSSKFFNFMTLSDKDFAASACVIECTLSSS